MTEGRMILPVQMPLSCSERQAYIDQLQAFSTWLMSSLMPYYWAGPTTTSPELLNAAAA